MEQLSLNFDMMNNDNEFTSISENVINSRDNAFGCCSRYRECSNAKRCVIDDADYRKNCLYRANLEKGNVFYGKNAKDFDINVYNKILDIYKSLDNATLYEMDCLIAYFHKFRSSLLWYNSNEMQKLQELGFVTLSSAKYAVLNLCTDKFISSLFDNDSLQLINIEMTGGARAKKADKIKWIMEHGLTAADNYTNRFVIFNIDAPMHKYIFELYYDFIAGHSKDYIRRLPLTAEPNFTKQKNSELYEIL